MKEVFLFSPKKDSESTGEEKGITFSWMRANCKSSPLLAFLCCLGFTTLIIKGAPSNHSTHPKELLKGYAKAYYQEKAGNQKLAKTSYQNLTRTDPRSFHLHSKYLSHLTGEERLQERQIFAAAQPESVTAWLGIADEISQHFYRSPKHQKLAIESLRKALLLHPHHEEAIRRLFHVLEESSMLETSRELLENELLSEASNSSRDLMLASLVRSHFDSKEPRYRSEQTRLYKRAFSKASARPDIARTCSDYYRKLGDLKQAILTLEAHRQANPSSLELRTRLALLYLRSGQEQKALSELHLLIEIHPELISAHQALAHHYKQTGQQKESLSHQAILLPLQKKRAPAYIQLSKDFRAIGQAHQAKLLLKKALFESPDSTPLMIELVVAAQEDNDSELAKGLLKKLEQKGVDPSTLKNSSFQESRAVALIKSGDFEQAEAALRTAIRTYRHDQPKKAAHAMLQLADLWDQQKIHPGAAKSLRKRAHQLEKK